MKPSLEVRDGARLAVTLLTILPVRGPTTVDRVRAGWAMTFAPLVGLGLAAISGVLVLAVRAVLELSGPTATGAGGGVGGVGALPALLGLLTLAVLSGGLHLDGLADLADGLGSRRDAAGTLEVMRQPTVGAFAVVALVFTIGVQVSALTIAIDRHHGTAALLVSVLTGRVAVAVTCAVPTQPARPEGLGALVVGSVPRARAVVVVAGAAVLAVAAGLLDPHAGGLLRALVGILGLAAGLLAAEGVRRLAARRIGGLNGDVLGSLVEVATTVSLLVVAL